MCVHALSEKVSIKKPLFITQRSDTERVENEEKEAKYKHKTIELFYTFYFACVQGFSNGTNGIRISFKVLPMVPLVIQLVPMVNPMIPLALPVVPMVPLYHW